LVEGNTTSHNGSNGLQVYDSSNVSVIDNVAYGNDPAGVDGGQIAVSDAGVNIAVENNTAGSTTETVNNATIYVSASDGIVFINGSGNTINTFGGTTFNETGSGNTYVLPAVGAGASKFLFNPIDDDDTFNLHAVLTQAGWNGVISDLGQYLKISCSHGIASLYERNSMSNSGSLVATFEVRGSQATLGNLLSHLQT